MMVCVLLCVSCVFFRICLVSRLCLDVFFFFKQKTAYEMRISDWSSDVCSSDLLGDDIVGWIADADDQCPVDEAAERKGAQLTGEEIGRASCRERVCQYV